MIIETIAGDFMLISVEDIWQVCICGDSGESGFSTFTGTCDVSELDVAIETPCDVCKSAVVMETFSEVSKLP